MEFPTTNVTRISNTQVELYSGCPLAWWFRYVLHIKSPSSIYLVLGHTIHEALSEYYRDHISGLSIMTVEEFIGYTKAKLEGVLETAEFEAPKTGKSIEEIVTSRISGLEEYMNTIGYKIEPLKTEHVVMKRIPNTDVDFLGVIDLITPEHVVDFKVCGKPWGPKKVRESVQPSAYSFLLGRPLDFQYHFIAADSPSKVISRHITMKEADDYIKRAGALALAMNEVALGRQMPTLCSNNCSAYSCDYMEACQFYKYKLYDDLMELAAPKEDVVVTIDGEDEA